MDKKWLFMGVGLAAWVTGLFVIKFWGATLYDGGIKQISFLAANFIVPLLALPLLAKLTGRTKHDMLAPSALIAMPAMFMDSVAVGFTDWYSALDADRAATGSTLLFAFWALFFFALLWHRPQSA